MAIYTPTIDGGIAEASGLADHGRILAESMLNGVGVSGAADEGRVFNEVMSGGVLGVAGEAFIQIIYDPLSGVEGIFVSGSSDVEYTVFITGEDGVQGSGLAGASVKIAEYDGTGGIENGGAAEDNLYDLVNIEGGGVSGDGSIDTETTYNIKIAGGISGNGLAEAYKGFSFDGSGGASGGGAAEVTSIYEAEVLQSIQLVTNSQGELGNLTNFPNWTYSAEHPPNAVGSFLHSGAYNSTQTTEYMEVNPARYYTTSVTGKHGDDDGSNYDPDNYQIIGVAAFDNAYRFISYDYVGQYGSSALTTLAQPLFNGDSTMQLVDASGWNNVATQNYTRQFVWWPFEDYDAYTYSRNHSEKYGSYSANGAWAVGGVSGNIITLTEPWAGPDLPDGTPIRNATDGGTYNYCTYGGAFPNEWETQSGYIKPSSSYQWNHLSKSFRPGTKYLRILWLRNYTSNEGNIRFSNVTLELQLSLLGGGVAETTFIDYVDMEGGAVAGGHGDDWVIWANIDGTSGAFVDGDAEWVLLLIPTLGEDGGLTSGEADETFFDLEVMQGGIYGSGTADVTAIYNLNTSGGGKVNGTSIEQGIYNPDLDDGGLLGGGVATYFGYAGWINPENIDDDDGTNKSVATLHNDWIATRRLLSQDHGFDVLNNSIVQGIEVTINWDNPDILFAQLSHYVQLYIDGNYIGDIKSGTGNSGTYTFGGEFDTWSTSLTGTDLNNATFGVSIKFEWDFTLSQPTPEIIEVDFIRLCTWYTTGHVVVNSTAPEDSVYNPDTSGGVVVNGSGIEYGIYNPDATGGAVVNGTTYPGYIVGENFTGGVVVNGAIEHTAIYNLDTTGGAVVNGSADDSFNDIIEIGGGVVVNSTAIPTAIYNIGALGGAIVNGEADANLTPVIYPEGGAVVNGTAEVTFIDFVDMTGGAVVGGKASESKNNIFDEIMDGGVVVNSTTDPIAIFNPESSGGAIVNGSADIASSEIEVVDGGVVVNGNTDPIAIYNPVPDGGAVVNGNATVVTSDDFVPEGGVVVNGIVDIDAIYNPIPNGGAIVGGSSDDTFYDIYYPDGGVVVNGTISSIAIYNIIPEDGVVVGGDTINQHTQNNASSGGAITNGTTDPTATYNPFATGGSTVGGTAFEDVSYNIDTAGGVILNGEANVPITVVVGGGVIVSGVIHSIYDETTFGGAIVSGNAPFTHSKPSEAGGGPVVGGDGSYFAVYDPSIGDDTWHFVARFNQVSDAELEQHGYPDPTDETADCYIRIIDNILSWRFESNLPAINTFRFRIGDYGEFGPTQITVQDPDNPETGFTSITNTEADQIRAGQWYIFVRDWNVDDGFILMRGQITNEPVDLGGLSIIGMNIAVEGGLIADGVALVQFFNFPEDGVIVGGESTIEHVKNISEIEGGAIVGGSAYEDYTSVGSVAGGVVIGGESDDLATYNIDFTGGAVVSGPIGIYAIQPVIDGGAIVNGTAFYSHVHNIVISGGAVVNGTAAVRFNDETDMTGGAVVSGEAKKESPIYHYSPDGNIIVIGGEADILGINLFRYYPDGDIIIIGGDSDEIYGREHEAEGSIIVDGTSPAVIDSYHYNPTGPVIIGGESETIYDIPADGGVVIGGDADINRKYFSYENDGTTGIIIGGDNQVINVDYYSTIDGNIIIIGGEAGTKYDIPADGGVIIGGDAEINVKHYQYTATGNVIIGGDNQVTDANYYSTVDGNIIIIGGNATAKKSHHEYEADGGLIVNGKSDFELHFYDRDCPSNTFRCKVYWPNPHAECPEVKFYYAECEVFLDDKFCDNLSKAMIAPIITCRQRFIMPPYDRRPDIPKR